jgi:hypothetical protein
MTRIMLDGTTTSLPYRRAGPKPSHRIASTLLWVSFLLTFSSTSAFSASRSAALVTLRLWGRTDSDDGSSTKKMSSIRSESDQDRVDEYLEFLDKRYRRLHDDSPKAAKNQFSALNWLRGGATDVDTEMISDDQHDNALFVLGVSELASERLLQNLHINLQQEKDAAATQGAANAANVIDVTFAHSSPVLVQAGTSVLARIGAARAAFIAFQNRQLERVLRVSAKAVTVGPVKVASAIWNHGGGKQSIAFTLSVLTTVLLLSVPLVQAIMKTVIAGQNSA